MTNEAIAVQVPLGVYLELAYRLRNSGDTRDPDDSKHGSETGKEHRAAAINVVLKKGRGSPIFWTKWVELSIY